MITFELFYKKTIPGTANLVKEEIKGSYIYIDNDNILIDNIIRAKKSELHSIDFFVRGYKNVIKF